MANGFLAFLGSLAGGLGQGWEKRRAEDMQNAEMHNRAALQSWQLQNEANQQGQQQRNWESQFGLEQAAETRRAQQFAQQDAQRYLSPEETTAIQSVYPGIRLPDRLLREHWPFLESAYKAQQAQQVAEALQKMRALQMGVTAPSAPPQQPALLSRNAPAYAPAPLPVLGAVNNVPNLLSAPPAEGPAPFFATRAPAPPSAPIFGPTTEPGVFFNENGGMQPLPAPPRPDTAPPAPAGGISFNPDAPLHSLKSALEAIPQAYDVGPFPGTVKPGLTEEQIDSLVSGMPSSLANPVRESARSPRYFWDYVGGAPVEVDQNTFNANRKEWAQERAKGRTESAGKQFELLKEGVTASENRRSDESQATTKADAAKTRQVEAQDRKDREEYGLYLREHPQQMANGPYGGPPLPFDAWRAAKRSGRLAPTGSGSAPAPRGHGILAPAPPHWSTGVSTTAPLPELSNADAAAVKRSQAIHALTSSEKKAKGNDFNGWVKTWIQRGLLVKPKATASKGGRRTAGSTMGVGTDTSGPFPAGSDPVTVPGWGPLAFPPSTSEDEKKRVKDIISARTPKPKAPAAPGMPLAVSHAQTTPPVAAPKSAPPHPPAPAPAPKKRTAAPVAKPPHKSEAPPTRITGVPDLATLGIGAPKAPAAPPQRQTPAAKPAPAQKSAAPAVRNVSFNELHVAWAKNKGLDPKTARPAYDEQANMIRRLYQASQKYGASAQSIAEEYAKSKLPPPMEAQKIIWEAQDLKIPAAKSAPAVRRAFALGVMNGLDPYELDKAMRTAATASRGY